MTSLIQGRFATSVSSTGPRSCGDRRVLAEHRRDLPPVVDPAQLYLPARVCTRRHS
jgi:hypothetical protein